MDPQPICLWDYDKVIIACGRPLSKKDLKKEEISQISQEALEIFASQFSSLADIQAAQLLNRVLSPDKIAIIYGGKPYLEDIFVKKLEISSSNINSQTLCINKLKLREGLSALSELLYGIAVEEGRETLKISWKKDGEALKDDEKDFANFIVEAALNPEIFRDAYQEGDVTINMITSNKRQAENRSAVEIPVYRHIPRLSEEKIKNIVKELALEARKILIITLGGIEHNIFFQQMLNILRRRKPFERVVFDEANRWDMEFFEKAGESREKPLMVVNSESFIELKILTEAGEERYAPRGRESAAIIVGEPKIMSWIREEPCREIIEVDLLSIFGVGRRAAYYTKVGLAYYIFLHLKKPWKLTDIFFPGVYLVKNPILDEAVENWSREGRIDDPTTIFEKLTPHLEKTVVKPVITATPA